MELIKAITPEQWGIIGETAISAIVLSPVMLGIKKWFKVHSELLMTLYVIGGAIITAMIAYVQNTPSAAPWLVVTVQGLITFALSQPVYYGLVKPARNKFRAMIVEANQLNEAKRSAALPADAK